MKESIDKYYKNNILTYLYEFGVSPQDVKDHVIDSLSPYFESKEPLEENATSILINVWLTYLSAQRDFPSDLNCISDILEILNDAKKVNSELTMEGYTYWLPEINQGISRLWSMINHQPNFDNLSLEDVLELSMSIIGKTIEGILKSFLCLILHLNRIKRGKTFDAIEIKSKDLGVIIDELISTSKLETILTVPPRNMRLNQWRNIAYHHNTKVENNKIKACCIRNGSHSDFNLSKSELLDVLNRVVLTFKLIRIAERIFYVENLTSIQKSIAKTSDLILDTRKEAKEIDFYAQITSQGFKVSTLTVNDSKALLKITDMQLYGDYLLRAIHASQFLYPLWLYSESQTLEVQYYTDKGILLLGSKVNSNKFENVNYLSEIVESIDFQFYQRNLQNKNPFEELDVPIDLQEKNTNFVSQRGDSLSLKEFITQFTLTLFCNYLALQTEGFEDAEISLKITPESAVFIGKGKLGNAVLVSPAKIDDVNIREIILHSLNLIIHSFNSSKLKVEIVEQAINKNNFYCKKKVVRNFLRNSRK